MSKQIVKIKKYFITPVLCFVFAFFFIQSAAAKVYWDKNGNLWYTNFSPYSVEVYWSYYGCTGFNACKRKPNGKHSCMIGVYSNSKKMLDVAGNSQGCKGIKYNVKHMIQYQ